MRKLILISTVSATIFATNVAAAPLTQCSAQTCEHSFAELAPSDEIYRQNKKSRRSGRNNSKGASAEQGIAAALAFVGLAALIKAGR